MLSSKSPWADPARERMFTPATVVTFVRTVASFALCMLAAHERSLTLLVVGLVVYWVGDSLDGQVARRLGCETRTGAVMDMLCDRFNSCAFYLGLIWLQPVMALPAGVYLFEFMVVDTFLSLAFLAWPIRSPNYFHHIDHRLWLWNWSHPGKALNSGLFAILLLVTGWWQLGLVFALALLGLKIVSLRRVLQIGLPIPARSLMPATSR